MSTKTLFKSGGMNGATIEEAIATFVRVTRITITMAGFRATEADATAIKVTAKETPHHPLHRPEEGASMFSVSVTFEGPTEAFGPRIRNDVIGRTEHESA